MDRTSTKIIKALTTNERMILIGRFVSGNPNWVNTDAEDIIERMIDADHVVTVIDDTKTTANAMRLEAPHGTALAVAALLLVNDKRPSLNDVFFLLKRAGLVKDVPAFMKM